MLPRHLRLVPLLALAVALVAHGRRVLATPPPTNVYVNTAWTGYPTGTTVSATIGGGTVTGLTIGTDAFSTISAGVTAVATSGNVYVLSGTYNEFPDVTKSVHLYGQQFGVDARTRSATETILNNSIALEASNIELNGFTVQGGDLQGDWSGSGIWTSYLYSGYQITNNIIRNNILGIYLNSSKPAASQNKVYRNLIQNNNYGYGTDFNNANGNGIYSDFGLDNVLIDSNKFTGQQNASMVLLSAGTPGNAVVISNNTISNDSTLVLMQSQNIQVTSNNISYPSGAGIFLGGAVSNITLTGNTIRNATNVGIGIADTGYGANSAISAHRNFIFSNAVGKTIRGTTYLEGVGYFNDSGATSDTPDITCNWWGASTGPKAASNPTGGGNWVVGTGTFNPWAGAIELTSQFTVSLLQTYANTSTRTYLQVVRVTNSGPLSAVGEVNLVLDNLSTPQITLNNATGTWTDACLPPQPSPMYRVVATGTTMLPGQSVNLTLQFSQAAGGSPTFNTTKIGGYTGGATRIMAAGAR